MFPKPLTNVFIVLLVLMKEVKLSSKPLIGKIVRISQILFQIIIRIS